jgi:hypothetical protein
MDAKIDQERGYCSIKFTLGALINHKNTVTRKFFKELGTCVDGTTWTASEAARFMNYFNFMLLDKGEAVSKIDEKFHNGAFTTIVGAGKASSIAKLGEALTDDKHLRPAKTIRLRLRYADAHVCCNGMPHCLLRASQLSTLRRCSQLRASQLSTLRRCSQLRASHRESPVQGVTLLPGADDEGSLPWREGFDVC